MKKYLLKKAPPKRYLAKYPDLERILLYQRSVKDETEAERFLKVSYERDVHDPFLMTDMDKAVSRILKAMEKGERIAVFGDFDADGLCASVCLKDLFSRAGYDNVTFYIPHRHEEGFGVSTDAIEILAEDGVSLMITVDCGIADAEVLEGAEDRGIDVIVTDHHEPVNGIPGVVAVVDPKRKDCSYPYKDLCGAGVVFKLIQGLLSRERFGILEGHEKWLLDLVGIATISDSVPLIGENRALAFYGLLVLRKSSRVGISKLCRKLNLSQRNITEDDVSFMIGPRLNAASRMGDVRDAFILLSTCDETEAGEAVKGLERVNNERKGVVASLVREIKSSRSILVEHDVIVAGNPNWRPSLLGLVANSLAQEYSKPVFLWGRDGSRVIKGSCRSCGGVDLLELMGSVDGAFEQFGGHRFAGGFSVNFESIHSLRETLNIAYAKNGISVTELPVEVDAIISLDDVTDTLYERVERFAPFGVGNPKPVFKFKNVSFKSVRTFGRQKEHLEIVFENSEREDIRAIGFFMSTESLDKKPVEGDRADLIATMERSYFKGRAELRLRIVDVV